MFTAAMQENRDAALKECQSGRETLGDQLDKTYVAQFVRILKGIF